MPKPTLALVSEPPDAVRRAPLPPNHKPYWTLRADFPAPDGTVFLRYSAPESGDDCLDVLTPGGKRLQRLTDTPLVQTPPAALRARYLSPATRRGPLMDFRQPYSGDRTLHLFHLAFPDGLSGVGTLEREFGEGEHAWNGLRFVEAAAKNSPDALDASTPALFPASLLGERTRFAVAVFGGHRFVLRWTKSGERHTLEILDPRGRRLAVHRLTDGFSATRFTSLSAMWLDEKRARGPVLETRDSDSVRLHVFTEGFQKLVCAQDFNDSSTSLYATTVSLRRDGRGVLTVTESYSERGGEDGSGGESHETDYVWTGRGFAERR